MILDSRLELCVATSIAAAAGTALVGSQIDLATTVGDPGGMWLVVICDAEIITAGSAGTVQFCLASDSTAAVHVSTSTRHLLSPTYVTGGTPGLAAEQTATGSRMFAAQLPLGGGAGKPYERFLGLLWITATTTTTAGNISAFLTVEPPAWRAIDEAAH